MRKVDLSEIKYKVHKNRQVYLWDESNGAKISFEYDGKIGELIYKYRNPDNKEQIFVEYDGKEFTLFTKYLVNANLAKLFEKEINWKYEIGEILHERKWNIKFTNREIHKNPTRRNKFYQFYCYDCGFDCEKYDYWINEDTISNRNTGCPCCSNKYCAKGINDIATTDPWMMEFMDNPEDAYKYTSCSGKKIDWNCPVCRRIKNLKISEVKHRGVTCTYCSDGISYGEKFMRNLFDSLGIDYIYQLAKKNFDWCDKYRYDFYLPKYDYIIEVHGSQHYELKPSSCFGKLEDIQKNDLDKYELAKDRVKKYIVIDSSCIEGSYFVDSIKNSELNSIIDWDNVDINEISIKSQRNILLDVCKYYSDNFPKITPSQLAERFQLNPVTISHYLNIGNENGLCNYDGKDVMNFIHSNKYRVPLKIIIDDKTYAFDCRTRLREMRKELFNGFICDKTIYKYADTNTAFMDKYYIYNISKEEFNDFYDNPNDNIFVYGDRFVLDIL